MSDISDLIQKEELTRREIAQVAGGEFFMRRFFNDDRFTIPRLYINKKFVDVTYERSGTPGNYTYTRVDYK